MVKLKKHKTMFQKKKKNKSQVKFILSCIYLTGFKTLRCNQQTIHADSLFRSNIIFITV